MAVENLSPVQKFVTDIFGSTDPEFFRKLARAQPSPSNLRRIAGSFKNADLTVPAALGATGTRSDLTGLVGELFGTGLEAAAFIGEAPQKGARALQELFFAPVSEADIQRQKELGIPTAAAGIIPETGAEKKEVVKPAPPTAPVSPFRETVLGRSQIPKELLDPFTPIEPPEVPDLARVTEALEAAKPVARTPAELKALKRDTFLLNLSQGLDRATEREILSFGEELQIIGSSLLQAKVASRLAASDARREDLQAMRQYNLALAQGELAETKFLFEAEFERTQFIADQQKAELAHAAQLYDLKKPRGFAVAGGVVLEITEPSGEKITKFIETGLPSALAVANARKNAAMGVAPGIVGSKLQNKDEHGFVVLLNEPTIKANWNHIFGREFIDEILQEIQGQLGPSAKIRDSKRVADQFDSLLLKRLLDQLLTDPQAMERFAQVLQRTQ